MKAGNGFASPRQAPTVSVMIRYLRNNGTWQRLHDALVRKVRKAVGKKIGGRKRPIVVDTLGLILSVVVHAA